MKLHIIRRGSNKHTADRMSRLHQWLLHTPRVTPQTLLTATLRGCATGVFNQQLSATDVLRNCWATTRAIVRSCNVTPDSHGSQAEVVGVCEVIEILTQAVVVGSHLTRITLLTENFRTTSLVLRYMWHSNNCKYPKTLLLGLNLHWTSESNSSYVKPLDI